MRIAKRLMRRMTTALLVVAVTCGIDLVAAPVRAQTENAHFRNWADLPPGEVGRRQLERGGPLRGYFQPVEVIAPDGADVALYIEDGFRSFGASKAKAGMLIGGVYRAKITRIPGHPGFEIYPSIEVIDRLFPPQGLEDRFPVPIVLTQDDLDRALAGEFVVRVVYLENPAIALPVAQRENEQRSLDVGPGDDPLITADKFGRPMAIVRIGARVPDEALGLGQPGAPLQVLRQDATEAPETARR
ncbi:MAG TPA: hypothetical protein DCQ98_18560 [Planctomycetaceae bacterium]|nr:hypothetical protein [Planctomycetaceae bacterium]HRF00140.1 hypothetical protein [Pirellulaceae bacterium]